MRAREFMTKCEVCGEMVTKKQSEKHEQLSKKLFTKSATNYLFTNPTKKGEV